MRKAKKDNTTFFFFCGVKSRKDMTHTKAFAKYFCPFEINHKINQFPQQKQL